jgi:hypothetical protein
LPGIVKFLGICAIVWGLGSVVLGASVFGVILSFAVKVIEGLLVLVGGIMVLNRARAGATLITIGTGLMVVTTVLSLASTVLYDPAFETFNLANDWYRHLLTLLGLVLLVLSLLPAVTKALVKPAGYGPPPQAPPGYGPPQQPPSWR